MLQLQNIKYRVSLRASTVCRMEQWLPACCEGQAYFKMCIIHVSSGLRREIMNEFDSVRRKLIEQQKQSDFQLVGMVTVNNTQSLLVSAVVAISGAFGCTHGLTSLGHWERHASFPANARDTCSFIMTEPRKQRKQQGQVSLLTMVRG